MNLPLRPKMKLRIWALLSVSVLLTVFWLFQSIPLALRPIITTLSVCLVPLGILWGIVGVITGKYRAWLSPPVVLLGVIGFVWSFIDELSLENLNDAASEGNTTRLCSRLDNAGWGPDVVDSLGNSLLMKAAVNGHPDTVRELLRRGARTGYRDSHGDTALSVAQSHHHQEIVELLRTSGASR